MEQAMPSPLGRLTCVLSALPTSPWSNRPRNRLPSPAPALSGDCNLVGVVSFCFRICCFTWKHFQKFATLHLVLADRRATARTTTRWDMQHPDKKKRPLVDSWVYLRLQAFRYKDCHYRYDERSNGPKFPGYLFAGSCCFVVVLLFVSCWCFQVLRFLQFTACTLNM